MPEGRLTELLIDDATWSAGSTARRHEWRLAINEILTEGRFQLPDEAIAGRATVTVAPTRVLFEVRADDGRMVSQHALPLEVLRPLMAEYMETIVEMSKLVTSPNSPRLEALDIAKRITHDEAGETVLSLMTDDVVFMTPGAEPFGREVFEAAVGQPNPAKVEVEAEIRELQVLGDWAFIRNHIDLTITPPGGAPMRRGGYTLTLLRKGADGRWRLYRDANLVVPTN